MKVARDRNSAAGLNNRSEDVFLRTPAFLEVLLVASEVACTDTGIKFDALGRSEVILNSKTVARELVASDFAAVSMNAVCTGPVNGEI